MNGIVSFRLCTLSDEELIQRVDKLTDEIYENYDGSFPRCLLRHIPALPDQDYDLLVGELLVRFEELSKKSKEEEVNK